jgi:hypothetical protein
MSIELTDTTKYTISPTGLTIHDQLSFQEWSELAPRINLAARSMAFVIGDWFIYGKENFAKGDDNGKGSAARVSTEAYDAAIQSTGLSRSTLQNYAHVSRKVGPSLRNEHLSWEHHKVVAKLPPADQGLWLDVVYQEQQADRPVSTRRLRRSIMAGDLLDDDKLEQPKSDRGIKNHIPLVNRLVALWSKMEKEGWLENATPEQREALKSDLEPIVKIYDEL